MGTALASTQSDKDGAGRRVSDTVRGEGLSGAVLGFVCDCPTEPGFNGNKSIELAVGQYRHVKTAGLGVSDSPPRLTFSDSPTPR